MSNTIPTDFRETFLAAFPREGETLKTGKRGRPARADVTYVANNANFVLKGEARRLAEENPWDALALLQELIYPLTDDERTELAESVDAHFQDIDPKTGHIIQTESRAGFEFSTLEDGQDLLEKVVLPCAKRMAKRTERIHFVRLRRWAVARGFRVGNGETLNGRTALFQHKIYISDEPQKNRNAFLVLAIVHPGGRVERLAKPKVVAKVTTEADATETKRQRDARRKREKRAADKAARETQVVLTEA